MVGNAEIENFYRGRKVFVTGHTGFKGAWLSYVLSRMGAHIKGYSLPPATEPSLYRQIEAKLDIHSFLGDINDSKTIEREILSFQPDYIFHLAAQTLVRKSYKEPLNTFSTNVMGTANVLNAVTSLEKPCAVVLITTDKVYENKEWHYPYRETDRLGGYDPYSASKACAELLISSYRQSFFNILKFEDHKKSIVSVRAGNVIGGGDWAEDRLIPDIVTSLNNSKVISIRHPHAIRPWQHVLEPVFGYLQLGALLSSEPLKYSGAWNFGPENADNLPVLQIAEQAIKIWGHGKLDVQVDSGAPHEAGLLKLDISKAVNELRWKPCMDTSMAIERTINWYKSFYKNEQTASELLEADILYYQSILKQ